ncbi:MAG: MFS transporter [Haloarculaceae archaeon]
MPQFGRPVNWRYQETVLSLAVFANFSQLWTRLLISPLVPSILVAFGVSKSFVGLALTGMWAAYALFQYPSGVFGDRFGERRVVLASLGSAAVAVVLLAASPSFPLFGVFVVLLGASSGLYYPAASSLLTRLYENTGQALGFHTAGGAFAGLLAPVVAAAVSVRYGWRAAILLGVVMLLPALVLSARYVERTAPMRPDTPLADRLDPRRAFGPLSDPALVRTTFLGFVASFAWQSFTSFFPTFLVEFRAFSTGRASVVFGAVMVISVVSLPILGRLSDRFPRDLTLAGALTVGGAGIAVFLLGGGLPATVAGVALAGIGFGWGGVLHSLFMDYLPTAERASGFGLVRTVYMLVGSLGSVITGSLADTVGWPAAYGFVVLLLAAGVALILGQRVASGSGG